MHMMMKYLQNFQWLEGSTDWKSYQSERGRERYEEKEREKEREGDKENERECYEKGEVEKQRK